MTRSVQLIFKAPYSTLEGDQLDGTCYELMQAGALGTAVETPPLLSCFVEPNESSIARILECALLAGLTLQERREVTEENWSAGCPELWVPIQAGRLEVLPVESPDDRQVVGSNTLKIIPGLGFGTGHHPTTRMILTVLSQLHADSLVTPTRVLDVGTGSGILAIAANKLFGIDVDAIDIDASALDNARDNCILNGSREMVHLSTMPIEHLTSRYDLILGNLYGEVLVTMAPQIKRLAAPNCTILLSGITDLVRNIVVEEYTRDDLWYIVQEYSEDSWVCLILQAS